MILPEPWRSSEILLAALCVWREARGESIAAKRGVIDVLNNRCRMAPAQGFCKSIRDNILKPFAFSSFNPGDPNATKYPIANEPAWLDSVHVAQTFAPDSTGGAVFYFSAPLTAPPHAWGPVEHTVTIGGLHFYRLAIPHIS